MERERVVTVVSTGRRYFGFSKVCGAIYTSIKTSYTNIIRMWNIISSPATPTVCLEQKSEHFQSRNVALSMPSPSKRIIAFEIICNVAYYSAAKFSFPIEQPSDNATKYGIRRSWKVKVKPNLGCCNSIAITISYISVFVSS